MYSVNASKKTEKLKKLYVVDADQKTEKLKKAYVVNAEQKLEKLWSSGVDAGEVVFTASKTWTVPEGVKTIDIFCVGGGGGAGGGFYNGSGSANHSSYSYFYGSGGGSGRTTTLLEVPVTPGETLTIAVGAAGTNGTDRVKYAYEGTTQADQGSVSAGWSGGTSSVKRGDTDLISAQGGSGGKANTSSNSVAGSWGGSGGGTGGKLTRNEYYSNGVVNATLYRPSAGGTDGSNGVSTIDVITLTGQSTQSGTGGTGQGTTTRAFGEDDGTLYARGGGYGVSEIANSGNGGGCSDADVKTNFTVKNASSGVVIIRWPEQEE